MDSVTLSEVDRVQSFPAQLYRGLSLSVVEKLGEDDLLVGGERSHRAVSVGEDEDGVECVSYSGCFSLLAYEDFVGDVEYEVGLSLPAVKNSFTFEFLVGRVVRCLVQDESLPEMSEWEGEYVVDEVEGELRFRVWAEFEE